jgi:hypothetical protein
VATDDFVSDDEMIQRITKRFRAGEAVHVNDDGTLSRIVDVRRTRFDGGGETQRQQVIAAVKDNYVREDFWSFYEIVPAGMDEDARAFADRPFHEWNGYEAKGMPSYLVGGDYVKTFNDDKITEDLVIDVNLSRPATLYVLLVDASFRRSGCSNRLKTQATSWDSTKRHITPITPTTSAPASRVLAPGTASIAFQNLEAGSAKRRDRFAGPQSSGGRSSGRSARKNQGKHVWARGGSAQCCYEMTGDDRPAWYELLKPF